MAYNSVLWLKLEAGFCAAEANRSDTDKNNFAYPVICFVCNGLMDVEVLSRLVRTLDKILYFRHCVYDDMVRGAICCSA